MQAPETSQRARAHLTLQEIFAEVGEELSDVESLIGESLISKLELVEKAGRYVHQSGGKRIRPALLLLSGKLCGSTGSEVRRFAAVMELIHAATLVHDDIVDEATLRRGQTSVNSLLGNGLTVLLGDYLYIRSVHMALQSGNLRVLEVICEITIRMIEGMMLELARGGSVDLTVEEHLDILMRKTAYLCSGCTRLGAMLAGADSERQRILADYGMNFGMAFQLVDDLLDFTASEDVLGKPVLQDLKEGHITLPVIYALEAEPRAVASIQAVIERKAIDEVNRKEILDLVRRHRGLERAREVAVKYSDLAKAALEPLPESSPKESLLALADYVIERNR